MNAKSPPERRFFLYTSYATVSCSGYYGCLTTGLVPRKDITVAAQCGNLTRLPQTTGRALYSRALSAQCA